MSILEAEGAGRSAVEKIASCLAWGRRSDRGRVDGDDVTLFACDSKSGNKGSIITPNLIRQALSESGYLDNPVRQ
ncbi:hypothetical protein PG996_000453 [Apiospora saccharicola]|uniref:Uncharacterized protein n=1 Tax=Apiospora saccharicola TaxID=335842 RepID=A0ABR1WDZ9_9PEZI